MKKTRLYTVKTGETSKIKIFDFLFSMFIFAIVLMLASALFKSFYVESLFYAFIAAIIITFVDSLLRPFITYITLPVTVFSFGLLYPIVNVIILKLSAFLLGSHFNVTGIFVPFFVSIFISVVKHLADKNIIEPIIGGKNK